MIEEPMIYTNLMSVVGAAKKSNQPSLKVVIMGEKERVVTVGE